MAACALVPSIDTMKVSMKFTSCRDTIMPIIGNASRRSSSAGLRLSIGPRTTTPSGVAPPRTVPSRPMLKLEGVEKAVRPFPSAPSARSRGQGGRGVRFPRAERRRKDDDDPDDCRRARSDGGPDHDRRARHRAPSRRVETEGRVRPGPALPLRKAHRARVPGIRRPALRHPSRRDRATERSPPRRITASSIVPTSSSRRFRTA